MSEQTLSRRQQKSSCSASSYVTLMTQVKQGTTATKRNQTPNLSYVSDKSVLGFVHVHDSSASI